MDSKIYQLRTIALQKTGEVLLIRSEKSLDGILKRIGKKNPLKDEIRLFYYALMGNKDRKGFPLSLEEFEKYGRPFRLEESTEIKALKNYKKK